MALVMVYTLELLPDNVYYIRQEETAINMQNRAFSEISGSSYCKRYINNRIT